ncbi:hypothetical protein PG984_014258 [Apiospora sp. TS-2023a]
MTPVRQPPVGTSDHHQTGHGQTKSDRNCGTTPVGIGASVRSSLDTPGSSSVVAWVFRLDYADEGQVPSSFGIWVLQAAEDPFAWVPVFPPSIVVHDVNPEMKAEQIQIRIPTLIEVSRIWVRVLLSSWAALLRC